MKTEDKNRLIQHSSFLGSKSIVNYLLQLILVLGVAGYFFFEIVKPDKVPVLNRSEWSTMEGFWCISYKGVVKNTDGVNVTGEKLASHLEALNNAGFHTITGQDVYDFLYNGKPLPERPVYLMFENGRKDTVLNGNPALKKTGYFASLYVIGSKVDSWDQFYLRKDSLKKLDKGGRWSVHSKGYRSNSMVNTERGENTGHFLTSRMITEQNERLENDEEFRNRIAGDYEEAFNQLSDIKSGDNVTGYIYPFSDRGDQPVSDPLSLSLNRSLVKKYFQFAFTSNTSSYNAYGDDPYTLKRISVPHDMDAGNLVERLLSDMPRWGTYEYKIDDGNADSFVHDWHVSEGYVEVSDSRLYLRPGKKHNSVTFWLNGSGYSENYIVEFILRVTDNISTSVFLRHKDTSNYLKFNIYKNSINVLQKRGKKLFKIAEENVDTAGRERIHVKLMAKNNRLFTWMDNKKIFPSPVYIPRTLNTGGVGFSFKYYKNVSAGTENPVLNIKFKSLPDIWLTGNNLGGIDRNYFTYIGTVAPALADLGSDGKIISGTGRFSLLMKYYGIGLMPTISLREMVTEEPVNKLLFLKDRIDGVTVFIQSILKKDDIALLRKGLDKISKAGLTAVALSADSSVLASLPDSITPDITKRINRIIIRLAHGAGSENLLSTVRNLSHRFGPDKIITTFVTGGTESLSLQDVKGSVSGKTDLDEEAILKRSIKTLDDFKRKSDVQIKGISINLNNADTQKQFN